MPPTFAMREKTAKPLQSIAHAPGSQPTCFNLFLL
jgi:hypothetical protein